MVPRNSSRARQAWCQRHARGLYVACATNSLSGGVVEAVEDVPHQEEGPHEAEHLAVEAERRQQRQEQHVKALPELVVHLCFPAVAWYTMRSSIITWDFRINGTV